MPVSNEVLRTAERIARQTGQSIGAVLSAWLDRSAAELPVEELGDDRLLLRKSQALRDAVHRG